MSGNIDKEKKFVSSAKHIITGDAATTIKELITGPKVGLVSHTSPNLVVADSIEGRSTLHQFLMCEYINGMPGLDEFIRMTVKVILSAELYDVKPTQDDEDNVLMCGSADYLKHGTKIFEWFPVVGLGFKDENTLTQGYVDESMSWQNYMRWQI